VASRLEPLGAGPRRPHALRRAFRFLASLALLGGAVFLLHLAVDPPDASSPRPAPPKTPWQSDEKIQHFRYDNYDASGRLAWVLRGKEAFFDADEGIRVVQPEAVLRATRESPGHGKRWVLKSENAFLRLPEEEMQRLRKNLGKPGDQTPAPQRRGNRAEIRFPGDVTAMSEGGLEVRTAGLVCSVPLRKKTDPEDLAAEARLETDREAVVTGPGILFQGSGFSADGESLAFSLRRAVSLSLDAHVKEMPALGEAFRGRGGVQMASPAGATLRLDPAFLDKRHGPFQVRFAGPVTLLDFLPAGNAGVRAVSALRADAADIEARVPPVWDEGGDRVLLSALRAHGDVRAWNGNALGSMESAFLAREVVLERKGADRSWTFLGEPRAWMWEGAKWRSGVFPDSGAAVPGAGDACLFVKARERVEVREESLEEGGKTITVDASGPVLASSWREAVSPATDYPLAQLADLEAVLSACTAKALLASRGRAETMAFVFEQRGEETRLRSFRASGNVVMEDFGGEDDAPEARVEAREARFLERTGKDQRITELELDQPSLVVLPGTRLEPFGAAREDGRLRPMGPSPRGVSMEGRPGSKAVLRSERTREGDAWVERERRVRIRGGGSLVLRDPPSPPSGGSSNRLEGEDVEVVFAPVRSDGSTRWVARRAAWKGVGSFLRRGEAGESLRLSGADRMTWERDEETGVERGRVAGKAPALDYRFAPSGRERGEARGMGGVRCVTAGAASLRLAREDGTGAYAPERVEIEIPGEADLVAWEAGKSPEEPEWRFRAKEATLVLGPDRRGVQGLASLETGSGTRFFNYGSSGVLEAWGEGEALRLRREGDEGRLAGSLGGPAAFFLRGTGAYPPFTAETPEAGAKLSWAHLESEGPIRLEALPETQGDPIRVSASEGASLTFATPGTAGETGERVQASSRTMSLEAVPRSGPEGGFGRAEISLEGDANILVWEGAVSDPQPAWTFSAGRAEVVVLRREGSAAPEVKTLDAFEGVQLRHVAPDGSVDVLGQGKDLHASRVRREGGGAWEGDLLGPAFFDLKPGGDFPPLEGKKGAASKIRTIHLATPGAVHFALTGVRPGSKEESSVALQAGSPATLSVEAGEEGGTGDRRADMRSEGLSVRGSRAKDAEGGWVLSEAKGEGETEVVERGDGLEVTATGRDFSYVPKGGMERFRGKAVRVRIEPQGEGN